MSLPNVLIVGFVTLPLVVASILSMVLILERIWFWNRLSRRQSPLVKVILNEYSQNPQRSIARLKQNQDLPVARVFLVALSIPDATPEEFNIALESAAQGEMPLLCRFQTVFNTIVAVAPLLGLLGTILGLIQALSSFEVSNSTLSRDISGVTAGINEALISTAAGLVVAIFTLTFANLFQGAYNKQRAFLREVGGHLELVYRHQYRYTSPRYRSS